MKGAELFALLMKTPLNYTVERQKGSHRRLVSDNGHPPLTFAFHDNQDIPRGLVRSILTNGVGLTENDALALL